MMANSKQLTLFECCSRGTTNNRQNRMRNEQTRSDTTSSSSSSTFLPCANDFGQAYVQLSAQHSDSEGLIEDDDAGEDDIDVINACPELMTTTSTREKDNVPTDIAVGPDQIPVQPKIKFPVTVKGNKHRSFRSEWYTLYRWLEYSKEKDAAYCYACRLFTTEPGKYWETFTKCGFRDWKHAMGKDGIITCHDHCKTHMQAMISWQEYEKNKERGTSVANRLDSTRAKLITKNRYYLKTILEVLLVCS